MKKVILLFVSFIIFLSTANAQKGINFSRLYPAGGKLKMGVDSSAKNVFYSKIFPNQPNTSFNYLPEVNNLSIQINFRQNIDVQDYRYTIIVDDNPIVLNKSIDMPQLRDTHAGGDEEIFSSTTLGTFPIKGKIITTLVYSVKKPQDIDKAIFYGKPIPKPIIKGFSKRFKTDKGVDYSWITDPKEVTRFVFSEKDDELTIVKNKSDIDYLYYASIKDRQTNQIIFESSSWQYGNIIEEHYFLPYLKIDKSIFKKSGNYEIIIQPAINWDNCLDCAISPKEIEKYITRHTLSITLDEQTFTSKQLAIYGIILCAFLGAIFGGFVVYIKKKNQKKLFASQQQKEIAKMQLEGVRLQLNPHFMFNALAGIQSLMNQNKVDEANQYLNKFSRLTRNVLDKKDLISLAEERDVLKDYLEMEQHRFGFDFALNIQPDVDLNTEIPAMLLQPFVENAVKHGIAEKGKDGIIRISFAKTGNDLMLSVTDNGQGFDVTKNYEGLGLTLSKNRINLLQSIYPATPLVLEIKANENGTGISLTLMQWL